MPEHVSLQLELARTPRKPTLIARAPKLMAPDGSKGRSAGGVLRCARMSRFALVPLLALTIGLARPARAGEPTSAAPAAAPVAPAVDDPLSIYVVTFGPGDHPFFKFGHDALLVRDRKSGQDRVYNFGTFRFAP